MCEAQRFKEKFPDIYKVYAFFAPATYGRALANIDKCLTEPSILLADVDSLYSTSGAAKTIISNQFVGLYSLSTAKESFNRSAADLAADIFLGKYGAICSIYALIVYFAKYLTDYKASFAQFDVQDILLQFGKRFLPWWRERLAETKNVAPQPQRAEFDPIAERNAYLLEEYVSKGLDVRQSKLYAYGLITEDEVKELERWGN